MEKMRVEIYNMQTGEMTIEWVDAYEPSIEEQILEKEAMLLKIYAELEALKNKGQ